MFFYLSCCSASGRKSKLLIWKIALVESHGIHMTSLFLSMTQENQAFHPFLHLLFLCKGVSCGSDWGVLYKGTRKNKKGFQAKCFLEVLKLEIVPTGNKSECMWSSACSSSVFSIGNLGRIFFSSRHHCYFMVLINKFTFVFHLFHKVFIIFLMAVFQLLLTCEIYQLLAFGNVS